MSLLSDAQRIHSNVQVVAIDVSFTRRLKRWSFTRIARGAEIGAYYNPNFIRNDPSRVMDMQYRGRGDIVGAAAETIASGVDAHNAAAAMAAAVMEKQGKNNKRKAGDMDTSSAMVGGTMDPRSFEMNRPYSNMPNMDVMMQQYFHMMMAQSLAQGAFMNYMNGQAASNNNQDQENTNDQNPGDANMTPHHFQGNMPFFPFPMMGMPPNMNQGMGMFPNNMQDISLQNYQGGSGMNQMSPPCQPPSSIQPANQDDED